jgi:hypothetical protein
MLLASLVGSCVVFLKQIENKYIMNDYPVYPEDDGYDRFRNPYSPV